MENFKKKYEYEILSKFLEDNNNNIFSYNSFSLYDNVIDKTIKILPQNYYNKISKNEQLNDLNYIIEDKFKFEEKEINNPKKEVLNLINNFEIVDEYIISYLNKLYDNFKYNYLRGEYIAGYNKLLIIFQNADKNFFYEIGSINNNIFTVEYLLNFNEKIDSNIFKNLINVNNYQAYLNNIYNNGTNNSFPVFNNLVCFSYRVNINYENNSLINNNNQNNYLNQLIQNIKNTLLSLIIFEKKFNDELEKSKNEKNKEYKIYFYSDCYLINKNYLDQFKKLFLYDKLSFEIFDNLNKNANKESTNCIFIIFEEIFKKYIQNYSNLLLSKENLFKFIDNSINLNPQNSKLRIKDNEFSISENFNIINEEIFKNMKEFQSISNKNINEEKIEKISFFINDG
jgi:hypothetical protein